MVGGPKFFMDISSIGQMRPDFRTADLGTGGAGLKWALGTCGGIGLPNPTHTQATPLGFREPVAAAEYGKLTNIR